MDISSSEDEQLGGDRGEEKSRSCTNGEVYGYLRRDEYSAVVLEGLGVFGPKGAAVVP